MSIADIYELYHRNEYSLEEATDLVIKQGFNPDDAGRIMKLAGFIPSVSDFLRFAVREVFTPALAEKYGQYEDYPEGFNDYAKLAGLSPEYAKYYWAAHWELPSISMGFDMAHRHIIEPEELPELLKALDVMPYWRDKIIQLSYTPYTRVDIRRMYQSGALNPDEVIKAYKDIGYDDEKAGKMAEFAMKETEGTTKELSVSEIIAGYEDGLLSPEDTITTIEGFGYSNEEASLLVQLNDFKRMRLHSKKYIDAVKKEFLMEGIDRNTANDYLNKLALQATSIEEILDSWELEKEPKRMVPTKAELLKWKKEGKIDEPTLRHFLGLLGYNERWIDLYLMAPPAAPAAGEEGV
jgi:hypothetical protein